MQQKRIIIIGATSGIGKEMAFIYARRGHLVGITGRRKELLDEISQKYPDRFFDSCFDVTGNENLLKVKELINALGGLDLLIYNSGIGYADRNLAEGKEMTTTRTNVNGFVEIVAFSFNFFAQQGYGQIALTSSVAALRGSGRAPAYSASKAFMSTYAEGLNIKAATLKKEIVITDIRPGFVDTQMAKGDGKFWVATPNKAAIQITDAIEKKKRIAYITKRWWLVAQILKLLPFGVYRRIA